MNLMRALRMCGAAAGVVLAGCSATHVGETWQCPLAQGTSCTTIAEADPAVPAARPAVLFGDPLPGADRHADGAPAGGRREAGQACDSGCGPLAWLKALFGADTGDGAAPQLPQSPASAGATEPVAAPDDGAPAVEPGLATTAAASLRVPEVLGRIWIAPFVDGDGNYREAHWVRVVLAPAVWNLP